MLRLLCCTLILSVFTEPALARDRRHAGPSNSTNFETLEAKPANAGQAEDEAVLQRRYEDTRELATLLGVPFDQPFLNKAFDFYSKRGLFTNDPNVSEDDIRSFISDVGGQEPSEELVRMGRAFVTEKKEEFQNATKAVAEAKPEELAKGEDRKEDREKDGEGKGKRRGRRGNKDGKDGKDGESTDEKETAGPIILPAGVPTGLASQIAGAGKSTDETKSGKEPVEGETSEGVFPISGQIAGGATTSGSSPSPQNVFNNPFVPRTPETAVSQAPAQSAAPRSSVPLRIGERNLSQAPAAPKLNIIVQRGTAIEPGSKLQAIQVPAPKSGTASVPQNSGPTVLAAAPVVTPLSNLTTTPLAISVPVKPLESENLEKPRVLAQEVGSASFGIASSSETTSAPDAGTKSVALAPAPIRVAVANQAPKSLVDKFRGAIEGFRQKMASTWTKKELKSPANEEIAEKLEELASPGTRLPAASESTLLKDFGAEVNFEPESVRPSWFFLISGVLLLAGGGIGLYRQRQKPSSSRAIRRLH